MSPEYIVICQQVVGSGPWSVAYSWDGQRFDRSEKAISHGFRLGRMDDFNVGVVFGGTLTQFRWMDTPIDHALSEIAKQIGLGAV